MLEWIVRCPEEAEMELMEERAYVERLQVLIGDLTRSLTLEIVNFEEMREMARGDALVKRRRDEERG